MIQRITKKGNKLKIIIKGTRIIKKKGVHLNEHFSLGLFKDQKHQKAYFRIALVNFSTSFPVWKTFEKKIIFVLQKRKFFSLFSEKK